MCLAVPARVVSVFDDALLGFSAEVDFGGALRTVSAACVPETKVGDYLIIHAGCAIAVLDEDAARSVLTELEALQQHEALQQLDSAPPHEGSQP